MAKSTWLTTAAGDPLELSIVSALDQAVAIDRDLSADITANVSELSDRVRIVPVQDGCRDVSWQAIRRSRLAYESQAHQARSQLSSHLMQSPWAQQPHAKWVVVVDCVWILLSRVVLVPTAHSSLEPLRAELVCRPRDLRAKSLGLLQD